jgi:hypothetical protein
MKKEKLIWNVISKIREPVLYFFFPRKDFSLGIFLWGFHYNQSIQSFWFLLIYPLTNHISVYFLLNYWFRMMRLVLVCFKNWVFNLHFFWVLFLIQKVSFWFFSSSICWWNVWTNFLWDFSFPYSDLVYFIFIHILNGGTIFKAKRHLGKLVDIFLRKCFQVKSTMFHARSINFCNTSKYFTCFQINDHN